MHMRVGSHPNILRAITCNGCGANVLPEDIFDHLLCCKYLKGVTKKHRHDLIVDAFIHVCAKWGIPTSIPTSDYVAEDSKKCPDIIIWLGDKAFVTDVSVVHMSAPSYEKTESRLPGSSLAQRATKKCVKYSAAASRRNHKFLPFIVSPRGMFHTDAERLIKACAKLARPPVPPQDTLHLRPCSLTNFECESPKPLHRAMAG